MNLSRLLLAIALAVLPSSLSAQSATLIGHIVDADSGEPIAARIYLADAAGKWHFPDSIEGSAVYYKKQGRSSTNSIEMHTTLSAHPFKLTAKPGPITVTIERGKEYFTLTKRIDLKPGENTRRFKLRRWINMAERGWFSGDTHVHRTLEELPNVMQAEDLNVTFPLVYWVTHAYQAPTSGNKNLGGAIPDSLIKLDDSHVIYPRNTEYEIFSVNKKRHTLGAIFFLNHKSVLKLGAPPIGPVAQLARSEGALLELDKHNWPWSMMLVAVLNVDLYELSNNHVWRTQFGFKNFGLEAPAYMKLRPLGEWSEHDWLIYGFRNYYALLNCGFNLRPTAGTASGVHPVPLGFGRVYVQIGKKFSYNSWIQGLSAGRSFVTTGPMLFAEVDGEKPGHNFEQVKSGSSFRLRVEIISERRIGPVDIIRNGEVVTSIEAHFEKLANGSYRITLEHPLKIEESSWVSVRYLERRGGDRTRFAHSGIFHFHVPGKPLRPRKEETDFLIQRMEEQIVRSQGVLSQEGVAEYERALSIYRGIAKRARP